MNIKDLKPGTYTTIDETIKKPVAQVPVASSTTPTGPVAPKLNINSLPPEQVKTVEQPGIVQDFAQAVASPFLKTASSVRDIVKSGADIVKTIPGAAKDAIDLARGTPEQRAAFLESVKNIQPTPATEYNYGYFGKKKAIGSTANILKPITSPENVAALKDAVGTGAEIASYIPFGGAAVTTGKSILARTLPKIKTLATEGAAAGALQGGGTSLQENKSIGDVAVDTGIGAVAGGVLAPVVGLPLGAVGGKITKQIGKIVDPEKEYRTSVLGNINKALGTLKKGGTLGSIPRTDNKKIQAFELMHDLAPNLKYVKNGEETTFDPSNVSPEDMAFALPKAKEYIYNIINNAKKEASGQGVKVNLVKAIDAVNEIAANSSLGTSRTNAEKLSNDLVRIVDENGNADIDKANQFAKDLNTRLSGLFNGTSDNLSREQEAMVSKEITDAIDHSMGTIFDTRFKTLQGQYSALKTIEEDVLRQYRKEVRQIDGVPQFIKDYGNAEILSGIINAATGNPAGLVKGLAIKVAGNKMAELRKPSTYLKRVFKDIQNFRNKKPVTGPQSVFPEAKKKVTDVANKQAYGAVAGIQQDDQGNVTFDPKAAVAGVAVGSLANKLPKEKIIEGVKKIASSVLRHGQTDPIGSDRVGDIVARERFNIPELPKISFGGSDRDVYDLGDGNVLKVIKTSRGIAQNQYSSDYYAEGEGLIPKTIEVGKNYLVKEKVNPPDAATKAMIKDLKDLPYSTRDSSYADVINKLDQKYGYEGNGMYPFGELLNYGDILVGDLKAARNWGTTAEGKPILLDEGTLNGRLITDHQTGGKNLNDPEFRDIYNQSRDAKKKFGDKDSKTMYGIGGAALLGASAAGSEKASAQTNKNPEEVKTINTSLDSVYTNSEKIAPMIHKDYIKTLVQRESSGGVDDTHRDADAGKYGWVVGFTKPTLQDIKTKAKVSQKYKNLIESLPGFDTPEDAIKSALIYSNFLLRDHTKEQTTGKREFKKINATQLYKLYNGGGSPAGVKAFDKEFSAISSKKKYD